MSDPPEDPSQSPSPPNRPPNPPIRYKFIDGSVNNPASLTQVKRHVMREFVRQKKWQEQQRQDTGNETDADHQEDGAGSDQPRGDDKAAREQRPQRRPRGRRQNLSDEKGKRASRQSGRDSGGRGPDSAAAFTLDPNFLGSQFPTPPPGPGTFASEMGYSDNLESVDELGGSFDANYFSSWGFVSSRPLAAPIPFAFTNNVWEYEPLEAFSSSTSLPFRYGPVIDGYQAEANEYGFRSSSGSSRSRSLSPWSSSGSTSSRRLSPDPQTLLSAARTDPFDTLPLTLDDEGKILFDFYANVMPACSYGFQARSQNAHNWYLQVFIPEAMKGAICFQNTILVHAANTQAWVRGLSETPASLLHRARGIQMLREHFAKHPTDISDAAISATLSAAAVEDFDPRPERKPVSWIHMRAAMKKIRDRGGPAAFQNNRRMAMLINWSDYIFSGYETNGPSFFFEHVTPHQQAWSSSRLSPTSDYTHPPTLAPPPISTSTLSTGPRAVPHPDAMSFTPVDEIRTQCEELIAFLHRSEQLAITQRLLQPRYLNPSRHTAFQPATLLFRILSSPPGDRYSIPGERKQIISRLAALMMINVALWDHRNVPQAAEIFLNGLRIKLLASEVDVNSSVEALLQILLASDDTFDTVGEQYALSEQLSSPLFSDSDAFQRPWFVGRMIKIAKRLGRPSWERLNNWLLSFLMLTVETPMVSSWEDDLRREILEAPLTSYMMPILQ
ncbi:hypothetical protein FQN52_007662 [Onygenales sp. PD_12]|nr:hypothetical protein FQN52_007662 [Onygenales sp. PD_12]